VSSHDGAARLRAATIISAALSIATSTTLSHGGQRRTKRLEVDPTGVALERGLRPLAEVGRRNSDLRGVDTSGVRLHRSDGPRYVAHAIRMPHRRRDE